MRGLDPAQLMRKQSHRTGHSSAAALLDKIQLLAKCHRCNSALDHIATQPTEILGSGMQHDVCTEIERVFEDELKRMYCLRKPML